MKKKNIILIASLCLVLTAAFVMPKGITMLEDYSLKEKTESYEIEEINLTPDDSYFYTELVDIQDYYFENRTYLDTGEKLSRREVRNIILDLYEILFGKENATLEHADLKCFIMPSADLQKLYVVWECEIRDENDTPYLFLIDDNTGKMLAFMAPVWEIEAYEKGNMESLVKIIREYYGFSSGEKIDVGEQNDMTAESDTYTSIIVGESEKISLICPLRIYNGFVFFNMYP